MTLRWVILAAVALYVPLLMVSHLEAGGSGAMKKTMSVPTPPPSLPPSLPLASFTNETEPTPTIATTNPTAPPTPRGYRSAQGDTSSIRSRGSNTIPADATYSFSPEEVFPTPESTAHPEASSVPEQASTQGPFKVPTIRTDAPTTKPVNTPTAPAWQNSSSAVALASQTKTTDPSELVTATAASLEPRSSSPGEPLPAAEPRVAVSAGATAVEDELKKVDGHQREANADVDNEGKGKEENMEKTKKRVLVLITGQSAREGQTTVCTERGREIQKIAAEAQNDNMFQPLHELGYEVHVQVVTNHCPILRRSRGRGWTRNRWMRTTWTSALKRMYKTPYVSQTWVSVGYRKHNRGEYMALGLKLIRSRVDRQRRAILRKKGLDESMKLRGVDGYPLYDHVIHSRPDVIPLVPKHAKALVADPQAAVFPFMCERPAWEEWRCVADVIFSIPGNFFFRSFRKKCLQRTGCFGVADQQPFDEQHEGFPNKTYHERVNFVGTSGHGCLACMEALDNREMEASDVAVKFVMGDDYYSLVNARDKWNPVYTLNSGGAS
mmetsp:Transcript_25697/g.47958  ORF Transcript_25697/g.47958 Transcript_25697/m.47958 type:complete len:551 (-) Transcript_25697:114-1766(-)